MSSKWNVVVAGATGTMGSAYLRALVAAGHRVRGTVRPGGEGAVVEASGGLPVEADLLDPRAAARALEGANALFISVLGRGPDAVLQERAMVENLLEAATEAGIRKVVYTSVHRAELSTGVPHFEVKGELEPRVQASGLAYTILRPATFMDAFRAPWILAGVLDRGELASPISADAAISYVAAGDVACFGVLSLDDERLDSATLSIGGPEALAYRDILPLLSELAGREVTYHQIPMEVARANLGDDMAAMVRHFNETGFTVDDAANVAARFSVRLTSLQEFLEGTDGVRREAAVTPGA